MPGVRTGHLWARVIRLPPQGQGFRPEPHHPTGVKAWGWRKGATSPRNPALREGTLPEQVIPLHPVHRGDTSHFY